MPVDWKPMVDLVHRSQRLLLTTHVRPDPDGLGSMLALADALEGLGKHVRLFISSVWPTRYDFLDPTRRVRRFELPGDDCRDADAVIVLDTGTWNQLGDFGAFMKTLSCEKAVIDHHISQDDLGGHLFKDIESEATGRLVYELTQALNWKLTSQAANFLFAALATDTGWFRHRNTTPRTYDLAEKLTAAGADPTRLYEQIYECSTLGRLKLMGLVLERLQSTDGGRIGFSEIRRSDYAATGATPQDTEDMISLIRSLDGIEVALFFMEQPAGGVKVSFRSRQKVDVAKIAEKFNGGGHRLASGAILNTSMDDAQRQVLEAVRASL
jgi:phosphoesterase RecJ-like protein